MLSHVNTNSGIKVWIHVLIWAFLVFFPILLSSGETIDYIKLLKFNLIPLFFHAIIFYSNYIYLINKYLFSKQLLRFILYNLLIVCVAAGLVYLLKHSINSLLPDTQHPHPHRPVSVWFFLYKDAISMSIPVIVSVAARTTEQWSMNEVERKEVEKEKLHSELQHLKYQLQPHFFFNSLNTIYALVERSPVLAQETIHSLSKLMRYMLYETDKDQNSLHDEIEFMKQYISLMKMRISDKTTVSIHFPEVDKAITISPLLFISLIENAFKHGVSSSLKAEINFNLRIENNKIKFYSENTNYPKTQNDKSGSGIGLINLKKRLELSYPGRYFFETKDEGNRFHALLEIEINHS